MSRPLRGDSWRDGKHSIATRATRLLLTLAVVGLLGCATDTTGERALPTETHEEIFLILPLNVSSEMPPELEVLHPAVWDELELYLRAQNKVLKTLSRSAARRLLVESIGEVRASEEAAERGTRAGSDDVPRILARKLRSHVEFNALIVPSLFVREAPISSRTARWDGVEREVEVEVRGIDARALAATPFEANAPAASLHIAVFDAQGEMLHAGLGGLEILVGVRIVGSNLSGTPMFQFARRADPLENRDHIREAVIAAFAPFLPPQTP